MDIGDDGDAHGGTVARAALLAAAGAGWGAAAFFLLRTRTPELALPHLDARSFFPVAELDRIAAFRGLSRWLWVAASASELLALALLAWRARPLGRLLARAVRGPVRTGIALALVAALAVWLATLPAGAAGHVRLRRFGLSEQGWAGWLSDEALSLAVTGVLVALAAGGAVLLAGRLGRRWWLAGGGALAGLGVLFALAQPVLIEPLFNRFTPLGGTVLAAEIQDAGRRLGVTVSAVEVADASRRTTAANAFVTGIGPTRHVVLYDTLLDGRFTRRQIVAVSAHELAHVARHHVWKGVAWFALLAVPGLALVARLTERRGGLADPALVPLALLCAYALFLVTLPAQNAISRRYEAEADWLALTVTRDPVAQIGLERRFALTALIDPDPPAWSRALLGTHPTVLERIGMAEAFRREAERR